MPKPSPTRKYSDAFKDLVHSLLTKDRTKRLGANGKGEILAHPFFADINIEDLK